MLVFKLAKAGKPLAASFQESDVKGRRSVTSWEQMQVWNNQFMAHNSYLSSGTDWQKHNRRVQTKSGVL